MSFQQAGGARSSRTSTVRFSGTGARRFAPILHVGCDTSETATHVDSYGDIFSDPGATPGASTNLVQLIQSVGTPFPAPLTSRGLLFIEARRTRVRRSRR